MDVGNLRILINADTAGLQRDLDSAKRKVTGFGDSIGGTLQSAGARIRGIGAQIATATAPLVALGVIGVHTASQFDVSMREISARTGLVGDDLETIRLFALQMGADTSFSAQQAAAGMLQLLASGSDATEAMATLPDVMSLAAASGMDLGYTADVLTNVMKTFGLTTDDAASIADTLTKAAGSSSATVANLTDALVNTGSQADLLGFSLTETVAALALLAERGLSGAEAGTNLQAMLRTMAGTAEDTQAAWETLGTTMFDAQGQTRPLADIIDDIATATASMNQEDRFAILEDLAGSYGLKALSALTQTEGGIDGMTTAMDEAAGASDVADAKIGGFAGAIEALQGSVETLNIEAFTPFMNDVLEPLARHLTEIVNAVTDFVRENPEFVTQLSSIILPAAAIGVGLLIAGQALTMMGAALKVAMGPLGLVALGIGFIAATDWEAVNGGLERMGAAFERVGNGDFAGAYEDIGKAVGDIVEATPVGDVANGIIEFLERITGWDLASVSEGFAAWGRALESVRQIVERIFNDVARRIKTATDDISRFFEIIRLKGQVAALDIELANPFISAEDAAVRRQQRGEALMRITDIEVGERVRGQLDAQLREGGPLDLGNIGLSFDEYGMTTSLETALALAAASGDYSGLAEKLGVGASWAIEDAMWRLAAEMQFREFYMLLPLAAELGIDQAAMQAQLRAKVFAALNNLAIGAVNVAVDAIPQLGTVGNAVGNFVSGVQNAFNNIVNGSHATGLGYVPWDGYVASLHQGERVLTRREARDYAMGGDGGPINVYVTAYGSNPAEFGEMVRRELRGLAR